MLYIYKILSMEDQDPYSREVNPDPVWYEIICKLGSGYESVIKLRIRIRKAYFGNGYGKKLRILTDPQHWVIEVKS
jgi:hypothetical protein